MIECGRVRVRGRLRVRVRPRVRLRVRVQGSRSALTLRRWECWWSELRDEANAARAGWRVQRGLCAPCSDVGLKGQVQQQAATRRSCARHDAHYSAAAAAARSAFRASCGSPGRAFSSPGRHPVVWALSPAWSGHTEHWRRWLAVERRCFFGASLTESLFLIKIIEKRPFAFEMALAAVLETPRRGHPGSAFSAISKWLKKIAPRVSKSRPYMIVLEYSKCLFIKGCFIVGKSVASIASIRKA